MNKAHKALDSKEEADSQPTQRKPEFHQNEQFLQFQRFAEGERFDVAKMNAMLEQFEQIASENKELKAELRATQLKIDLLLEAIKFAKRR